jgi:F-type H+-transporting ATPase subunit b
MALTTRTLLLLAGTLLPMAAATAATGEGEQAAGGSALITPAPGLFIWTSITFLILLLVLWKTAWKPLLAAVEGRERTIRDAQESARKDREQAASMLVEQRDLVAQARRERAEAVAQGQRDAERLKAEILEEARRQRDELLKGAEVQIQAGLRQAQAELRATTAETAIAVAEKLLARSLDDATQRRLVEEHLQDLERARSGSLAS